MFAAAALLVVVVAFRVVFGITHAHDASWLHNFSPLSALALCGAIYFPRRVAFAFPLAALLISDLIINAHYGVPFFTLEILPHYAAFALVAGLGWMLRGIPRVPLVLGASVLGSALFFFVTNTASWLAEPDYGKTLAGWTQALTTGLPNAHPTTLEFFRNTLASDVLFTALFVACMAMQRHAEAPAPRRQEPAPWC